MVLPSSTGVFVFKERSDPHAESSDTAAMRTKVVNLLISRTDPFMFAVCITPRQAKALQQVYSSKG
jgi:hypothetical protein